MGGLAVEEAGGSAVRPKSRPGRLSRLVGGRSIGRRQQGRDRPPVAHRPHLGAPHPGVDLFPGEIGQPTTYAGSPKAHGLRSGEIRNLKWLHVDLDKKFLTVGRSKTQAGEGRTIPLNPALQSALEHHAEWYALRFGRIEPDWYLFPFGRANDLDPTRPITTIKTASSNARERAGVEGRMHDSRHTLITELSESGAGDQTIMDIVGHVSGQMLKHYSHIRMQAKRDALQAIWEKQEQLQGTTRNDAKAEAGLLAGARGCAGS